MDRRIKKSQDAIMNALISLMAEKEFEKITINEIADCANVNRGTVYFHYMDKYHILDCCIESHLEQLGEGCFPVEGTVAIDSKTSLLRTFQLMEKNADLYTTLLTNKGLPAFRNRLQEIMIEGIHKQIVDNNINLKVHKDILAQFLTSATVGVIEWWIIGSMPYSAEDITEQLWTLLELNQMIPVHIVKID
ncbi:TetR/AcrR family transcriptional regulator [Paenibacillus wynnii]|uniref:TetR/AcrR family transcriptional regulator n=1 Tax=Paenibacillus wynnii TaxID=268407 RepID=UPI002791DA5F|nr:TetR/AcrR family transcriptional regulator [Paenibacillus wynnii]MDQ0195291.1 AcrR family transcriptional regulator [Paenibacillus wynnii]